MSGCPWQGLAPGKPLTSLSMGRNRPVSLRRRQSAVGEGRRRPPARGPGDLMGEQPLTQGLEPQ